MVKCPRCGSRNVLGLIEIVPILIGLMLFLLPSLGVGMAEKYSGHNVSFEVPANWSVTKDEQLGNDTFVVLNNSSSSIRIDIVSYPSLPTLRSVSGEHNHTLDYMLIDHLTKMLNDRTFWQTLTGSIEVHPDDLYYPVSFQTTENSKLIFAWTKPEYMDKYIVVKGVFSGPQDIILLNDIFECPVDLVDILNSFRTKYSRAEENITSLVNKERVSRELSPLVEFAPLMKLAQLRCEDMATAEVPIDSHSHHDTPHYGNPLDSMKKYGIINSSMTSISVAENAAITQDNVSAIAGWMNSSGHRANILNPAFTQTGVGMVKTNKGIWYVQMFLNWKM
jgi:hypothetical protein